MIQQNKKMFFLALLPFLSGIAYQINYLPNWISIPWPLNSIITEGSLFSLTNLCILYVIYKVYGKILKDSFTFQITLFSIPVKIIGLTVILGAMWIIGVSLTPFFNPPILWFLQTILVGPTSEDLLSRTFFIKYSHLDGTKFLFWSCILGITFSLNHLFYEPYLFTAQEYCYLPLCYSGLIEKFFVHFCYGFVFTLIVYRTKRFEFATTVHIISNSTAYIYRYSAHLGNLATLGLYLFVVIILAGATYKKKRI